MISKKEFRALCAALLCAAPPVQAAPKPSIKVVFPAAGAGLGAISQCYVIGAVTPTNAPLTVNGQRIDVWHTGSFLYMAKLKPGANTLRFQSGATVLEHRFNVARPSAAGSVTAITPLAPTQPAGVYTGETVRLACQAPAGSKVSASVGEREVTLTASPADATSYSARIRFDQPVENVPVSFFAPGLADKAAATLTARTDWPAWRVTGPLFETRARAMPGSGKTIAFLGKLPGMEFQGGGYNGSYMRLWLSGQLSFVHTNYLALLDAPPPPRSYAAPDISRGYAPRPVPGSKPADLLVVIDPGHGGRESGALGPSGLTEKEVNLQYSIAMRDALRRAGFRVLMTREKDVTLGLYERARLAYDAKAAAFISVHHNATAAHTDPDKVRHVSTYAWHRRGMELARALHPPIAAVTPIADRGVMFGDFAVCRNPAVPSCLLELDFINCPAGEEAILRPEQRQRVAEAIVQGMLAWIAASGESPAK